MTHINPRLSGRPTRPFHLTLRLDTFMTLFSTKSRLSVLSKHANRPDKDMTHRPSPTSLWITGVETIKRQTRATCDCMATV